MNLAADVVSTETRRAAPEPTLLYKYGSAHCTCSLALDLAVMAERTAAVFHETRRRRRDED